MLSELNSQFALADRVQFATGVDGQTRAILNHSYGSSVEVYLLGATVTSWQTPDFGEILYLSPDADFEEGKAIRGGIPLVFPQFGPGKLPSHGFARNNLWNVVKSSGAGDDPVSVSFSLKHSPATSAVWPHEFELEYTVTLTPWLITSWSVKNTGSSDFNFENALHTYFRVGDIGHTSLHNLRGLTYLDNCRAREAGSETRGEIKFDSEFDRIYLSSPKTVSFTDHALERVIYIKKTHLSDSVVWNPWIEKARGLKDFPDDGYKEMLCVESGNIKPPLTLAPGGVFSCTQEVSVENI